MNTKRIDQYICIDVDAIMVDELEEIISMPTTFLTHEEDIEDMKKLKAAAKIVLKNFQVPGQ